MATLPQSAPAPDSPRGSDIAIRISGLSVWYGNRICLEDLDLDILAGKVTALIGPTGCGKSTLLRSFNRMNEMIEGHRMRGEIEVRGRSITGRDADTVQLRRQVGMVFQEPNPFPKSIYDNVAFGCRVAGIRDKLELDERVESALVQVGLWTEVRDQLTASGTRLSGGQRQRLCIARALAIEPEILLMDEPCSALDPVAASQIEELIREMRSRTTVLIVTHNMQQAGRVSDRTAFLFQGRLIEEGETEQIFLNPRHRETEAYLAGRFG